jgi:HEPN domain-containing protein
MDAIKRATIEGWIDKAFKKLMDAKENQKYAHYSSESVQAAQECVELSVKALLEFLEIKYPLAHGWNKEQLGKIAEQIQQRQILQRLTAENLNHTVRLPRLLFLANFWAQFYMQSKYGMEAGYLASAKELFGSTEAETAIRHAEECYQAVSQIKCLDGAKLTAIVS